MRQVERINLSQEPPIWLAAEVLNDHQIQIDEDNHKFVTGSTIAANLEEFSTPQQGSYR